MAITDSMTRAVKALDQADAALSKLDAGCCEPGRSPRISELGNPLATARSMLAAVGDDPDAVDELLAKLEDAGSQIGSLQVGCCAPNRMPLYGDMLTGLMTVQRSVNQTVGRGH